ncbi:MAG: GT4 family glycosyltransferase PelF [Solirubrobacteraceae bacterium]
MPRLEVVLCTEGTYPFAGGGVSTWCDLLCRELEEVDYTLYAVTGSPEVARRFELPPNVSEILHVPLWGLTDAAELSDSPLRLAELRARRRATTDEAIEREFLPLLGRLLDALHPAATDPPDGTIVHAMWGYFQRHEWTATWRSGPVWRTFVADALGAKAEYDETGASEPSMVDLMTALRWMSNYLLPLAAPLPEADIVHSTIAAFAGLVGVLAKLEHGTPFLVTEHGVWVRERYIAISAASFSPFAKRFLMALGSYVARLNYRYADIVAPVNAFNRRWEVPYGAADGKIVTINNGVDPGLFTAQAKPREHAGVPVVVAAARVFPLKDIETMIRAAAVARESLPDIRFLVYGSLDADLAYVERCRTLIADLELEDTFELRGHHSKPAELYNEGDISALSSIPEAFPYTVLESMACGRPVVATDVGGVREALEGYGIVVPPRDPDAFGAAVVQLLEDEELRTSLGRQARENVLAKYRLSTPIEGYRRLYQQLAPAPNTPRA